MIKAFSTSVEENIILEINHYEINVETKAVNLALMLILSSSLSPFCRKNESFSGKIIKVSC